MALDSTSWFMGNQKARMSRRDRLSIYNASEAKGLGYAKRVDQS